MTTPTDVTYTASTTVISSAHMNGINDWVFGWFGVLGEVFTAAAGRTALLAASSVDMLATSTLGYTTGAGGTVAQSTSKATAVTLNKAVGKITMDAASLAANTIVSFTLTNSTIGLNDLVVVNVTSGSGDGYNVWAHTTAAGQTSISLRNVTAGALAEAVVLSFAVVKGVVA